MLNVYIGYDQNEPTAWDVCAHSLRQWSSIPLSIIKLDQQWLRRIGLYRRQFHEHDGQRYDCIDGKPFSTEFSYTRFLVPSLQPSGIAVFMDSDFLWRKNIGFMINAVEGERAAVSVVKHNYQPPDETKMRGQVQTVYPCKNWSSLMVWNCDHPLTKMLTPYMVNTMPGSWLHQFSWLQSQDIGRIEENWNWLDGHSQTPDPWAVHFTRGTPDMPGWEDTRYAHEWRACLDNYNSLNPLTEHGRAA